MTRPTRPLQNRCLPDGKLYATPVRGLFMGNRGGKIHDPQGKLLTRRRWVSKRWIICATNFKNRRREVMGNGYTELFFMDEPTALAAGHRPCFECRREAAIRFSACWFDGISQVPNQVADICDLELHDQRLASKPEISWKEATGLPCGACLERDGNFWFKWQEGFLNWNETGYRPAHTMPSRLRVITPMSTIRVLSAGYEPRWHDSVSGLMS